MGIITAGGLALGTGFALDRLLLPELRSEPTSATGPVVSLVPGPHSSGPTDAPAGTTPGAAPEPTRSPPPLKPIQGDPTGRPETPTPSPSSSGGGGGGGGGGEGTGDKPSGSTSAALEAAVVQLTNTERATRGCSPLRVDSRLVQAARRHSRDMAEHNYFDHTSRNGDSPWDRMEDAGYPAPGAENIARGQPTAAAVVEAWMKSPGHRRNILNCDLKAIGVGVHTGSGGPWWTQDFGWR